MANMQQRERLLKRLRREPTDRAPFICPGGMMSMVVTEIMDSVGSSWPEAHADAVKMAALTLGANRLAGVENAGVPFCMTVEAEAMGAEVTLGSKGSEPRVTSYAMETLSDLGNLKPIATGEGRAGVCIEAIRILKRAAPDVPIVANLSGPVSLASSLVDPLVYYRALLSDKAAVHKFAAFLYDNLVRFGDAMIDAGADVVCVADPSATGELIGRKSFAEFVLPYINGMAEHFREKKGVPVIVHICGDVRSLGTVLADVSAEAISIDAVVGIRTLREMAPNRLAMGNVSTYMLEKGRPDAITKRGKRCVASGADILAPACGISPITPIKNITALSRAVAPAGRPTAPETEKAFNLI
jgi:MtaA/CmuA family methyltransferase